MKELLKKILGIPGVAIYYLVAIAFRLVSLIFLIPFGVIFLFFYNPIIGNSDNVVPDWYAACYRWYCMEMED